MVTVKEIKSELKRLKIKGISRKNKAQLLAMLPKTGGGITDWMKNAVSVIRNPSNALTKKPKQVDDMLKKFGNNTVVEFNVCRSPIDSITRVLLNTITLGNFSKEQKKYNYDEVYHLFAILKLDNGIYLKTERNQRVVLRTATINDLNKAKDKINIKTNIKLNDLFENAIKVDGPDIWRYGAMNNNCQKFITSLLKHSNYFNSSLDKFVNQDVSNLLKSNVSNQIAKKTTDIASLVENVVKGGSHYKLKGKGMSGGFIDEFVKSLMSPPPRSNGSLFDSLKRLAKNPEATMKKAQGLLNDYNGFQEYQKQQNMKKLLPAPATVLGSGRRKKKIKKVKFQ